MSDLKKVVRRANLTCLISQFSSFNTIPLSTVSKNKTQKTKNTKKKKDTEILINLPKMIELLSGGSRIRIESS